MKHIHLKEHPEVDIEHMFYRIIASELFLDQEKIIKLSKAFQNINKKENKDYVIQEFLCIIKNVLVFSSPEHFEEEDDEYKNNSEKNIIKYD